MAVGTVAAAIAVGTVAAAVAVVVADPPHRQQWRVVRQIGQQVVSS